MHYSTASLSTKICSLLPSLWSSHFKRGEAPPNKDATETQHLDALSRETAGGEINLTRSREAGWLSRWLPLATSTRLIGGRLGEQGEVAIKKDGFPFPTPPLPLPRHPVSDHFANPDADPGMS